MNKSNYKYNKYNLITIKNYNFITLIIIIINDISALPSTKNHLTSTKSTSFFKFNS